MTYEKIADTVQEMVDRDATAKELLTVLTMLPTEKGAFGRLLDVLPRDAGKKVCGAVLERMADDGHVVRCGEGQYVMAPHKWN